MYFGLVTTILVSSMTMSFLFHQKCTRVSISVHARQTCYFSVIAFSIVVIFNRWKVVDFHVCDQCCWAFFHVGMVALLPSLEEYLLESIAHVSKRILL